MIVATPSVVLAATVGCDPSCKSCSTSFPIRAVPCDPSSVAQRGWSSNGSLSTIKFSSGFVDGCATWTPQFGDMHVEPCSSVNGGQWVNSTVKSCKLWNFSGGASSIIHSTSGCQDNVGRPIGCLDVHGKVGPGLQLTKCYGQPNDAFTIEDGVWASQDAPPTFPRRCMEVVEEVCPFAACCTACAPGRHFSADGFCELDMPPASKREVYVWLAADTNATGVTEAIQALVPHRASFSGVVFQYYSICGKGAAPASCPDDAYDGPARLMRTVSNGTAVPDDLSEQLRRQVRRHVLDTRVVARTASHFGAIE